MKTSKPVSEVPNIDKGQHSSFFAQMTKDDRNSSNISLVVATRTQHSWPIPRPCRGYRHRHHLHLGVQEVVQEEDLVVQEEDLLVAEVVQEEDLVVQEEDLLVAEVVQEEDLVVQARLHDRREQTQMGPLSLHLDCVADGAGHLLPAVVGVPWLLASQLQATQGWADEALPRSDRQ